MTEDESDELPEGWARVSLTEVFHLNPPKPKATDHPDDTPVTFVPMPAVDAVSGTIATPSVRPFAEVRKGFTAFRNDDVILAKITPCMENGKAAVARGLTNGLGFGSTEFHVFRPTGAVLPDFLFHFLRQESFRREAEAEMTGSVGQKRVPAEHLKGVELPIPPLDEQRRIVTAVEVVLAKVSSARERLERVAETMKRFRQAVLAAACSGRLTADWRDSAKHPAPSERFREDVLRARDAAIGGRNGRIPAEADNDYLEELPPGWALFSLEELTTVITSGSRDWTKYYGSGTGTFIMAQNVRPGTLDLSTRQQVGPPANNRDAIRSQVATGDLLVTIVGANTGDLCPVDRALPEHYVCQSVALLRPVDRQMSRYLNLYFNSTAFGRGQFNRYIYGEGRPHLGFDQIKRSAVALPPLAEQQEVVRRVAALFALADSFEQRAASALKRVESLTQAVLAKAFRGELVPTEAELARREKRTYETGEELLTRIRLVTPSVVKSKRSRKVGG